MGWYGEKDSYISPQGPCKRLKIQLVIFVLEIRLQEHLLKGGRCFQLCTSLELPIGRARSTCGGWYAQRRSQRAKQGKMFSMKCSRGPRS